MSFTDKNYFFVCLKMLINTSPPPIYVPPSNVKVIEVTFPRCIHFWTTKIFVASILEISEIFILLITSTRAAVVSQLKHLHAPTVPSRARTCTRTRAHTRPHARTRSRMHARTHARTHNAHTCTFFLPKCIPLQILLHSLCPFVFKIWCFDPFWAVLSLLTPSVTS